MQFSTQFCHIVRLVQSNIRQNTFGTGQCLTQSKGLLQYLQASGLWGLQSSTGSCQVADKDHFHTASSASGGMVGREPVSSGLHKFLFIVTLRNITSQIRLPTAAISFLDPVQHAERVPPSTPLQLGAGFLKASMFVFTTDCFSQRVE